MNAKFAIKQSRRNGQFKAYVIGANGETVFTSEQYLRRAGAEKALRIIDPEGNVQIDYFDKQGKLIEGEDEVQIRVTEK